jgi:hypothetical protein
VRRRDKLNKRNSCTVGWKICETCPLVATSGTRPVLKDANEVALENGPFCLVNRLVVQLVSRTGQESRTRAQLAPHFRPLLRLAHAQRTWVSA